MQVHRNDNFVDLQVSKKNIPFVLILFKADSDFFFQFFFHADDVWNGSSFEPSGGLCKRSSTRRRPDMESHCSEANRHAEHPLWKLGEAVCTV